MTVYNKPQWLNQSIDSVLDQTYQDWELLIMEDNSPDPRVKEIIETYSDARIRVFHSNVTEEKRYLTARYATLINIASQYAKGKYFTYLTDDDYYYPNRLELMVDHLHKHPQASVVYGAIHNVDVEGHYGGTREANEVLEIAFDRVDHNAVMHTRDVFFEVGGWYNVPGVWGGADAYFWRRLNEAGYLFYPISDVVAAKRYHESSVQWLIANNQWPGAKEDEQDV